MFDTVYLYFISIFLIFAGICLNKPLGWFVFFVLQVVSFLNFFIWKEPDRSFIYLLVFLTYLFTVILELIDKKSLKINQRHLFINLIFFVALKEEINFLICLGILLFDTLVYLNYKRGDLEIIKLRDSSLFLFFTFLFSLTGTFGHNALSLNPFEGVFLFMLGLMTLLMFSHAFQNERSVKIELTSFYSSFGFLGLFIAFIMIPYFILQNLKPIFIDLPLAYKETLTFLTFLFIFFEGVKLWFKANIERSFGEMNYGYLKIINFIFYFIFITSDISEEVFLKNLCLLFVSFLILKTQKKERFRNEKLLFGTLLISLFATLPIVAIMDKNIFDPYPIALLVLDILLISSLFLGTFKKIRDNSLVGGEHTDFTSFIYGILLLGLYFLV